MTRRMNSFAICEDCPLWGILERIEDTYSESIPNENIENMNMAVSSGSDELKKRAAAVACVGPKVIGTVCGLDEFAKINNYIHDAYQQNIKSGE